MKIRPVVRRKTGEVLIDLSKYVTTAVPLTMFIS